MALVAVDAGREFDCGVCRGGQAQFGDLGGTAPCEACEIISKHAPLAGRKLCGGSNLLEQRDPLLDPLHNKFI